MSELRLSLLGTPRVEHGARAVRFPTRKVLGLLAYLATEGGLHPRDKLVALLWPDSDESSGRATLRSALARLREGLDDCGPSHIIRDGIMVGLDSSGWSADLHAVERSSTGSSSTIELESAAALCRGEFLEGFALPDAAEFEEWLAQQRQVWGARMARVLDRLSQAQFEQGQLEAALGTVSRLLLVDPLNEAGHRRLIQLHLTTGNRAAALRAYEACCLLLARELGVSPAPETSALGERIRTAAPRPQAAPIRSDRHGSQDTVLEAPLVGRELPFMHLIEAFRAMRQNEAQAVIVQGEAGIGKTRLADDFVAWAAAEGADVLRGRAFETGGRLPYQPLLDTLRLRLEQENAPEDLLSDVWLMELSRLLPELRDRYPDLAPSAGDDTAARARLYEAVARLGQALAARAPLVLFIDDVQWADAASLDVLHYAVGRWAQSHTPVLLVLAVRSEALASMPALTDWITALGRAVNVRHLTLQSLAADDTELFVERLGIRDGSFARWLYEETGGQPFFIVEMLKALLQRGALTAQRAYDKSWNLVLTAPLARTEWTGFLPPGVRDVVRVRLAWLTPAAQALVSAAAVLGQGFTFELTRRVAKLPEEPALAALEEALRGGLLREDADSQDIHYSFVHDKIRDVTYAEAGQARRQLLHRRAFEALNGGGVRAAELAHHAFAAGLWEEGLDLSVAAGDEAMRLLAARDAAAAYQQAITAAERVGRSAILAELHARRGQAFASVTAWPEARKEMEVALDGLAADRRAEVLVDLAMACHWLLDVPSTRRYAAQALALSESVERDDLAAGAIGALAFAESSDGELAASLHRYREAFSRAGALSTPALVPAAEMSALISYWSGRYEEAIAGAREAIELARRVNDQSNAVRALGDLGMALGASGHYGQAIGAFGEARRFGQEYRIGTWVARAISMQAGMHLDLFDFATAEALAEEARTMARSLNFVHPIVSGGIDLLLCFARRGEVGRAEALIGEVAEVARTAAGAHGWLWRLRLSLALAEIELARGSWTAAFELTNECLARAHKHGRPKYRVLALAARAHALSAQDRDDDAVADLRQAVGVARQLGSGPLFVATARKLLLLDGDDRLATEVATVRMQVAAAVPTAQMRSGFEAFTTG